MKKPITLVLLVLCIIFSPAIARSQDTAAAHQKNDTAFGDKTFMKVEIESEFPGGPHAWLQFLRDHLVYPKKAWKNNIEGTVILQFIVNKDSSISDLSAISGDPLLVEAALKAMARSPRWTPAVQYGRTVKSYKRQPVVFKLQ
jgi:protein TonB